jgi:stearoyl-CoA desaturase (delta-9 desaturase)
MIPESKIKRPRSTGSYVLPSKTWRQEQLIASIVHVTAHLGLFAVILHATKEAPPALSTVVAVAMYVVTMLGITVGFHRHFTHQSFKAVSWLRAALAIAGSMALQGSILRWVSDHRRHHRYSDRAGDPHSPHVREDGTLHQDHGDGSATAFMRGIWWAHIGWIYARTRTRVDKYAPDLLCDKLVLFYSRSYVVWFVMSILAPPLIVGVVEKSWSAGLYGFWMGTLLRLSATYHTVWAVNSLGHAIGKRPFSTSDQSTNISWLAPFTFGDSYHNNHHAFPTSAKHGLGNGELDLGWMFLRLMHRCGWVSDIIEIPATIIERRRVKRQ